MTRYKTINGMDFQEVKKIPCNTRLRGGILSECYKTPSPNKIYVYSVWEDWKIRVNTGFSARITDMYIAGYNSMRFTLVFKGYTLQEERPFIIAVTASHNYIKYED